MSKQPISSADILNDRVIPFFYEHGVPLLQVLTDRGTEYCGEPDTLEYRLFLALNDIDHTKTKAKHQQTNWICERFNKTCLDEFYKAAFLDDLPAARSKTDVGSEDGLAVVS